MSHVPAPTVRIVDPAALTTVGGVRTSRIKWGVDIQTWPGLGDGRQSSAIVETRVYRASDRQRARPGVYGVAVGEGVERHVAGARRTQLIVVAQDVGGVVQDAGCGKSIPRAEIIGGEKIEGGVAKAVCSESVGLPRGGVSEVEREVADAVCSDLVLARRVGAGLIAVD